MATLLQRLFSAKHESADGLTQPEREAIADALHFCMYADGRIELAETKVLHDWNEALAWDPNQPFSTYEPRSLAAVRQALVNFDARLEFVLSIVRRIQSEQSGNTLLRLCRRLADADGKRSDAEHAFITALSETLATSKK